MSESDNEKREQDKSSQDGKYAKVSRIGDYLEKLKKLEEVVSLSGKLSRSVANIQTLLKEKAEKIQAEKVEREAAEEAARAEREAEEARREQERLQREAEEAAERARKEAEERKALEVAEEKAAAEKAEAEKPVEQKPVEEKPAPAPANEYRPSQGQTGRPQMGRTFTVSEGERRPRSDRPQGAQGAQRPAGGQQRFGQNAQGAQRPMGGQGAQRPMGGQAARPAGSQGARPVTGGTRPAPAAAPKAAPQKGKSQKKKEYGKTFVEGTDRNAASKRDQLKRDGNLQDTDEYTGFRKVRTKKDKRVENVKAPKIERAVVTSEDIPLKTLSEKIGVSAAEITKRLFREGIMKTVNESVDLDTAQYISAEFGVELEYKPEKTAEEMLVEQAADTAEEIDSLVPRAPVVTVMGHVDHGKTSLLDYIRKTQTAAGEAGGITQKIGAYTATVNGRKITFIDTPGHEAFTAMRARGAQITDIVILVVAGDDGVMPQTVEAINHAKAANVEIIVAINKMDKPGADASRVMQELTTYELVPEEWGGSTIFCPISCKTGEGIDKLLESLLLTADMMELLANPAREARGTVIEASLDKGMGPIATVLVQNGTLKIGDNLITGTVAGKVRAMMDDSGKRVKEAGPSTAVNVLGLDGVPHSGDQIHAVSQTLMKQVVEERKRKRSDEMSKVSSKLSFDEAMDKFAEGDKKTLNIIVKGDTEGSVEAIKQSVLKLSGDEVTVKVIHGAAGAINESDVSLAQSSKALILGFNVRPDTKAKALAESSGVDVRCYSVIYSLLDDVEAVAKGLKAPKFRDVLLGKCEVRQTFKITGAGNVAGCYVTEGKIVRGEKLRIYRDDVLIVEGGVRQLKRFKDDVKEVAAGFECGCAIDGFNGIQIGDVIECYSTEQVPA